MKPNYYKDEILRICDNNHLSVDEIFHIISQNTPQAALSSIYRNVEELADDGLLKRICGTSKKNYFEKTKEQHGHLIDREKWIIMDIDLHHFPSIINHNIPNFDIGEVDLKIYGSFKTEFPRDE